MATNSEFKRGDEVYYKKHNSKTTAFKKFRILEVKQLEAPPAAKQAAKENLDNSLYGKEIQQVSRPSLSFVIEPLTGGEKFTVKQGEIELTDAS